MIEVVLGFLGFVFLLLLLFCFVLFCFSLPWQQELEWVHNQAGTTAHNEVCSLITGFTDI